MQSSFTRADPLPALQICTTVYNSMVDIDKAIDKEIGRIPLDTLVEYRRELTTESFIHGGIVPHFHMPAFITSHSFLKCPAFDDHFWSYRLTKENFQKAQRSFPIKEGKKKGALERLNPRTQQWAMGWCEIDREKFYWYNREKKMTDLATGAMTLGARESQKLLKAVELAYIQCVFLSGRDRGVDGFRDFVMMTEQRSYMLRAKNNKEACEWLEEIVRARKFAWDNESEEDRYHRLHARRLEPRDGTVHVHDDLEAALAVEKEIQERHVNHATKERMETAKGVLRGGVKALSATKKLTKSMVGLKTDDMVSSLDGHSGYTKAI